MKIFYTLLFSSICLMALSQEGNEVNFGSSEDIPFGLEGYIYFPTKKILSLPKTFDSATALGTIHTNKLDIPERDYEKGFPGVSENTSNFIIDYHGFFYVKEEQEGQYEFQLTSDDGSKLIIDDSLIIAHDNIHPFTSKAGKINLKKGIHKMNVQYFQGIPFNLGLQLKFRTASEDEFVIFDFNEYIPTKIERSSSGDYIKLESNLLFDSDNSVLKEEYYQILEEVYKSYLKENDTNVLILEGHTDNTGSKAYNDSLSIKRTKYVTDYLSSQFDIKGRVLEIGYGKSKPKYLNDNEEHRHKNRRVEIKIMERESAEKYFETMSSEYITARK